MFSKKFRTTEYTVLEIQLWSIKSMVITSIRKIRATFFVPIQAMQRLQCVDVNKKLQKVFNRV